MESIPIYFIIELASQTNIIYEQLSSNVISKLCIKKLYLMSPNQYIDRFLTKVCLLSNNLNLNLIFLFIPLDFLLK